jgi:hypothetical protein
MAIVARHWGMHNAHVTHRPPFHTFVGLGTALLDQFALALCFGDALLLGDASLFLESCDTSLQVCLASILGSFEFLIDLLAPAVQGALERLFVWSGLEELSLLLELLLVACTAELLVFL